MLCAQAAETPGDFPRIGQFHTTRFEEEEFVSICWVEPELG
jgi:hypothetical protein